MLKLNCDIGERSVAHPVDDELMRYIDIANIASGGHAGDQASVDYYVSLAKKNNVLVSAHFGYPDKANFGRKRIDISQDELFKSLDQQLKHFDHITMTKPHGALYFAVNEDQNLARAFIQWATDNGIKTIIHMPYGCIADIAPEYEITLLKESFLERGYFLKDGQVPYLISRGQPHAQIKSVNQALQQYRDLSNHLIQIDGEKIPFTTDTACVHSDSDIALDLIKAVHKDTS